MYLTVNLLRFIATLVGCVLLLTASHMISRLFKFRGSPPHLLMRLRVHHICSLLLFWQPLISLTSLSASIGPHLKHQQVGYAQIFPIGVTYNPILGVALFLLPRFTGESTMKGGGGGKQ